MEKISHIVRGNSRVASTDLKGASAVRAGTPSFGRPVNESVAPSEKVGTTASRAVALHNELEDRRNARNDHAVDQMTDQFFMSRVRRPVDPTEVKDKQAIENEPGIELSPALAEGGDGEISGPVEYTPRGSFVDVKA